MTSRAILTSLLASSHRPAYHTVQPERLWIVVDQPNSLKRHDIHFPEFEFPSLLLVGYRTHPAGEARKYSKFSSS
jgi:hypothetical protein